jgi:hypothetical protein
MTDELKFPSPGERHVARDADSLDEQTVRAIHNAYLPPVAVDQIEYWNTLQQRIMARVGTIAPAQRNQGWLTVLNGWAEVGLVAAAALFAVGGFVSHQLGEPEDQVAYESEVQPSTPEAISARAELITASDKSDQRDAALQYILSY